MSERQTPYGFPKPTRYRDKKHLDYVRFLPCTKCGRPGPSDPHHVSFIEGTGVGTKPSDMFVIPLCHPCHMALHVGSLDLSREEIAVKICRVLAGAYRALKGR